MYRVWKKSTRRDDGPIQQTLAQAFSIWAERHPDWAAALFDESFLRRKLVSLFANEELPLAVTVAEAWVAQFHLPQAKAAALVTDLTPLAADFLALVVTVRCEQNVTAAGRGGRWRWLHAWWPGSKDRRVGSFS